MSRTDTCLSVVRALDEKMRTTSMEHVRVTDLCKSVGISRATFYEYFDDIFAVATWMWDYLMSGTLYQVGVTRNCYDAHLSKFNALLSHREFFENAMRTVEYESICQHGGRMMAEHVDEVFRRKAGRPMTGKEPLWFEFYNKGAKHMTRHWVERGMVEPPEVMAELFTENMPDFLLPYLEPGE